MQAVFEAISGGLGMEISPSILLATAVKFLEDGGDQEAADLLRDCRVNAYPSGDTWYDGDETLEALHVEVFGGRQAYDVLNDRGSKITESVRRAIAAAIPPLTYIK